MKHPNAMLGIPTGYQELDRTLRGWQKSRFYLVAGRPGLGKSSLLAGCAMNAAKKKYKIAFFSLEMGHKEIMNRLAAIEAKIDTMKLSSGKLSDADFSRYTAAINTMSNLPFYLHVDSEVTPMGIRSKCRTLAHTIGLDAVFVDYVQLVEPGMARFSNREQEVAYVSRSLKRLSMELDIPVIAAAQLSRAPEQRSDKRPQLSELRESGGLEQDCDAALLMYSDNYYNENGALESDPMWIVEAHIAKHRNGPTGRVELGFLREYTQFVNVETRHLNGAKGTTE
jgi:replicative DNA helicase